MKQETTFTTTLAWVLIVLLSLMFMKHFFQVIMLFSVFPSEEFNQVTAASTDPFDFIFANLGIISLLLTTLNAILLICAVALLKRENWARIVFVIAFCMGIAVQLGMMVFQWGLIGGLSSWSVNTANQVWLVRILMTCASIIFMLVFGWLVKKLTSAAVRQEFVSIQ